MTLQAEGSGGLVLEVLDPDEDGVDEILLVEPMASPEHLVLRRSADGGIVWTAPVKGLDRWNVMLAELTGSAPPEIVTFESEPLTASRIFDELATHRDARIGTVSLQVTVRDAVDGSVVWRNERNAISSATIDGTRSIDISPDVDGDGIDEVLHVAFDGLIVRSSSTGTVLSGSSGAEIGRIRAPAQPGRIWTSPIQPLGDASGDGAGDFLVVTDSGLEAWSVGGSVPIWRTDLLPSVGYRTASLSGQGTRDIYASDPDHTVIDGSTGVMRWRRESGPSERGWPAHTRFADVDLDGATDVLCLACWDGYPAALSGLDGSVIWTAERDPMWGDERIFTYANALLDLNADGVPDPSFVGSNYCPPEDGPVRRSAALDGRTGKILWSSSYDAGRTPAFPFTGDVNSNGRPDVYRSSSTYRTLTFEFADGTTLEPTSTVTIATDQQPEPECGASIWAVFGADANGDGTDEVVVSWWDEQLRTALLDTSGERWRV